MGLNDHIEKRPVQASGSYRAWQINSGTANAVDLAWYSRNAHSAPEKHRLLPFTEPSFALRRRFLENDETLEWDFVIFKAQPNGGAYEPRAGEELFALRLAPELMEIALDLKATDHFDEDCSAPMSIVKKLSEAARLADKGDFRAAWASMHRSLSQGAADLELDRAGRAAQIARHSQGTLGPSVIAEQAGLSARHMRRTFVERFGLSPRAIQRRQRLTAMMLQAERQERPCWAGLAIEHNYSDQAHMIRECRILTGLSPREWHKTRRAMAVSFNT